MTEKDYEEEFADEEDEIFNDEEDSDDSEEDEDLSPEESGFLKGYKEAGKRKKDQEEE